MGKFMKQIKIYGTGCPKCNKLQKNAEDAAKNLGIEYEVEKVSSIEDIMAAGIMMTPGLAIDGKMISTGSAMSVKQIEDVLKK
jgi:small redox-active disulfide protein 2